MCDTPSDISLTHKQLEAANNSKNEKKNIIHLIHFV